ncbi:putative conserved hypothetical protein [Rosellinia necatrix]|uniref:SnoaL-like domain-containing protein n=1 Tax=Rosellinia necatrix TaxID=77044 RepID=A0A1W2TAM3_ROSNE|nr:putative conserved hypothetical protein [Rosellinia necatrix]
MAPSAEEITKIFNSRLPGGTPFLDTERKNPGSMLDIFTEDCKVSIMGQEFDLAHSTNGFASSKDFIVGRLTPTIFGSIDESKPMKSEIVRVIGGGADPCSAVEFKSTATSLKGKPWVHECMFLIRWTDDGKISEIKAYLDTLHLQNHFLDSAQ